MKWYVLGCPLSLGTLQNRNKHFLVNEPLCFDLERVYDYKLWHLKRESSVPCKREISLYFRRKILFSKQDLCVLSKENSCVFSMERFCVFSEKEYFCIISKGKSMYFRRKICLYFQRKLKLSYFFIVYRILKILSLLAKDFKSIFMSQNIFNDPVHRKACKSNIFYYKITKFMQFVPLQNKWKFNIEIVW